MVEYKKLQQKGSAYDMAKETSTAKIGFEKQI